MAACKMRAQSHAWFQRSNEECKKALQLCRLIWFCGTVMQPYLTTCCCGPAPLSHVIFCAWTFSSTLLGPRLLFGLCFGALTSVPFQIPWCVWAGSTSTLCLRCNRFIVGKKRGVVPLVLQMTRLHFWTWTEEMHWVCVWLRLTVLMVILSSLGVETHPPTHALITVGISNTICSEDHIREIEIFHEIFHVNELTVVTPEQLVEFPCFRYMFCS
jgi:hypothetical protein